MVSTRRLGMLVLKPTSWIDYIYASSNQCLVHRSFWNYMFSIPHKQWSHFRGTPENISKCSASNGHILEGRSTNAKCVYRTHWPPSRDRFQKLSISVFTSYQTKVKSTEVKHMRLFRRYLALSRVSLAQIFFWLNLLWLIAGRAFSNYKLARVWWCAGNMMWQDA